MPKESREGFQSAAGLVRYFDSEADTALKIPPWGVILLAIASGVVVLVLEFVFPV